MTDENSRLKTQRIFIIAAVIIALLFAGGNIWSSMQNWNDGDAAPVEGPVSP